MISKHKSKLDTYKDENDTTEEKDTKYVLEQLSKSEGCLNECPIAKDCDKNCPGQKK